MKIESKIRTKLLLAIFIVLALVITVFSIFVSQNYRQNLGLGKILSSAVEDAEKASEIFDILMGAEVAPRKKFIQTHAKSVKNLDI